jgi:phosphatidylinositol alpha-mannosyltransferase
VRIGIVTEYYYPSVGGIQEHVHNFAREARRLGHTAKIITSEMPDLRRQGHVDAAGADVLRLGTSLPIFNNGGLGRVTGGTAVGAAVRELLARERFDVVHVHAPLTPVLPLLAIHHATGPVVGTFHTNFKPGLLYRLLGKQLQRYLDRLDAAIAVSNACLNAFTDRLHAEFRIIPNGVDVERFSRGRPIRRHQDGKLNVLYVGRLEPRNGLDRLVASFHRVWRQIPARLIVMGDGPLLPRYRAMVPQEMAEDVIFTGRVLDERPDWYATADVYCAPARIASFGVTLLEAMAAGKPVLASDIDGYREVLTHGREGELISGDDTAGWARALIRLAREPARAAGYAERGRLTVQRYAWPVVTREVLGLYRSIGVRG